MNLREIVPPANAFTHSFSVPQSDIDALGHAGNVTWVRWVNEAAAAHSASVGLDLQAYRELGFVWVVRKHEIEYLAPAFEGDQVEATTWVAAVRGATSTRTTVFRKAGGGLLARATTTWVLLTLPSGKPARIPKELLVRFGFTPASAP
jgi:acyl-CoA thioester hydrolase